MIYGEGNRREQIGCVGDEAHRILDMGFEPQIRKISLDIIGYLNNPIPVRDVSLDLVEQTIEIVEENEKFYLILSLVK
ncbi:uncharacterized protein LOC142242458 isoform X2 [Haematobia irritans]|uniref:uncharacterized protein LOC142234097 isoform X2 n=1 Tax=Haematobia irritans TaxID=7368 RepID=UPI003F500BED